MRQLLSIFLVLGVSGSAVAGFWDYDTLRARADSPPGTLELMVGKSLRHSRKFYQWRIGDRRGKIAAHEDGTLPLSDEELAAAYDDWAVALAKLGHRERAWEVLAQKADHLPEVGRYRTLANRGTILIELGRRREGIAALEQARAAGGDQDLAREKYQILLAKYVLDVQGDAQELTLPLAPSPRGAQAGPAPFAAWLLAKQGMSDAGEEAIAAEIARARQGVEGLMRFGNYQSPVLLEALGDLLLSESPAEQDVGLAVRAYLLAAMEADEKSVEQAYRQLAGQAAGRRGGAAGVENSSESTASLEMIEIHLAIALKEARNWFEHLTSDEALWVEKWTDPTPDERFWQKYGNQVIKVGFVRVPPAKYATQGLPWWVQLTMGIITVLAFGTVLGMMIWRKRKLDQEKNAEQVES